MDNDKFDLLISILEDLEKEDVSHSNLESAIVKIIDQFDTNLTNEQKNEVLKEFIHYEKVRREEQNNKKILAEEEKNRELLDSFLAGESFGWGD